MNWKGKQLVYKEIFEDCCNNILCIYVKYVSYFSRVKKKRSHVSESENSEAALSTCNKLQSFLKKTNVFTFMS